MDPKQDTFNETVSTLLERKVRGWLSGVIDDMRRSSPVQQWLDSLPESGPPESEIVESENVETEKLEIGSTSKTKTNEKADDSITENTVIEIANNILQDDKSLEVPEQNEWKRKSLESGVLNTKKNAQTKLQRDFSVQSEGCRARRVDAESVLLALGFGPSEKQQKLQRIPDRFLRPSKVRNPHVPPSTIVAKIIDCLLQDEVCREEALMKTRHSIADMRSAPAIHAHILARLRST
ncbi:unnamed protein product [Leptidea sinapis]|uniref:ITPR-interacting domain-containing protein n=1 Tax=Leptidea sinapis TaxID=189913 RepID=A0A5E4QYK6_9NEOP|nr:unnamed protein product [Leptidea sinapis]